MRLLNSTLLLIFLLLLSISNLSFGQSKYIPGVVLVKFEKDLIPDIKQDIYSEDMMVSKTQEVLLNYGFKKGKKMFTNFFPKDTLATNKEGQTVKLIDLSRWYIIEISDTSNIDKCINKLLKQPGIIAAVPGEIVKPADIYPDDPRFLSNQQWGLYNYSSPGKDIHAPAAWELNQGRNDVIVAVVDGGVDYNHDDLDPGNRSRVIQGIDTGDDDNDPMDNLPSSSDWAGHGTSVSGIIGAITDNNLQVAGIMWNCKIMPVKIATNSGWGIFGWGAGEVFNYDIGDGIDYARSHGADVINMSFGGQGVGWWEHLIFGNPVREATWNAYQQGIVLVAAMGNDDNSTASYPAAFNWTIAVGATNQNDQRITGIGWGSNFGSHINLTAPGISYYSTKRYQSDGPFSGTSCATPVVSGVAGLILSESLDNGLNLTNDDVLHLMENSATKVAGMGGNDWTQYYGFGRVNAEEALKYLNAPYTFTHATSTGGTSVLNWNNHWHTFFNNAGLASGNYVVKQYKVTKTINFSPTYQETPLLWTRERTTDGWSGANPNLELPYVNITSVTNTSVTFYTFIYYIISNSAGQQLNEWWPTSPSNAKIDYTVVGKPHYPPIISHFTQNPDPICKGSYGYVYVHLSQGNGNLSYNWQAISLPTGAYLTPQGDRCKITYPNTKTVVNKAPVYEISCTVTNGAGSDTENYLPHFDNNCGGSGCPTLAFYNSDTLLNENPILVTSLNDSGHDVIDYYLINHNIMAKNNFVNLVIHEPETEHTWLDQIELIKVKANDKENIAVTDEGEIVTFKKHLIPHKITLNDTLDITNILGDDDTLSYSFDVGDKIIIELNSRKSGGEEEYGVMSGEEPHKDEKIGYLKQIESANPRKDNGFGNFYLRPKKSIICKNLGILFSNQLEFTFYKPVKLNYFAIVKNIRSAVVESCDLISAKHNLNGNVLQNLLKVDQNYSEILPDEKIDFTFKTNSNSIGNIRYIFKSTGRYEERKTKLNKQLGTTLITEEIVPTKTELIGNYPNPFNPETVIKYSLKDNVKVNLEIFNMLGQKVKTLINEYQSSGYKTIVWNGLDDNGNNVSSGVYIYKLISGDFIQSKKMILMR